MIDFLEPAVSPVYWTRERVLQVTFFTFQGTAIALRLCWGRLAWNTPSVLLLARWSSEYAASSVTEESHFANV